LETISKSYLYWEADCLALARHRSKKSSSPSTHLNNVGFIVYASDTNDDGRYKIEGDMVVHRVPHLLKLQFKRIDTQEDNIDIFDYSR